MKNVKLMTVATLAALSLSTVGGLITQADTVDYDSNGVVEFIPNTDPTKPVDPTDPDPTNPVDPVDPDPYKPVDPVDPTDPNGPEPGTPGPLSIDYASSFDFGTQKISTQTHTYNAALQKYKNDWI